MPITRLTQWLLSTGEKVSASIASQLANGLFASLPIFIGGVLNSTAVAGVAAWRMGTTPFIGWVIFEAGLGLVRVGVVHSSRSAEGERLDQLRQLACWLSIAWASSVGIGTLLCLISGDWVLASIACLSTAAMVCGICLRNFGTPRLAAVMTFSALAPCAVGGLMTHEPALRIISVQLPIFMVTIFSASFGLHRLLVSWMTITDELNRSKALNETILQSNPDLTLMLDENHQVMFSNRQPDDLICQSMLVGRDFYSILEEKDRPAAAAALARAKKGEMASFTACYTRETGEKIWFDTVVNETSDASGRFIVVARDVTRQKHSEERAMWMAHHDTLTGLPNRAVLQERLDAALMHSGSPSDASALYGSALLIVDVDNFKTINDTLGHDGGDVLLRALAARLRSAVGAGDLVARTGGDEFALIVAARDAQELNAVAARIYEELREPILHGDRVLECGASIGASFIPQDSVHNQHSLARSDVMKAADIALYAAKAAGRAQMKIFEPAMMDEVERYQTMIASARYALKRKTIMPHYQPKVSLRDDRIIGFEALLRWRDRDGHVRGPDAIKAAFADPLQSAALSDRMLGLILDDIERWIARDVPFGHVAVNVTSADFRPGGIVETVLDRLEVRRLPASSLQIEVTEDVFLDKGALDVERALKRLSHHGLRIALDDFGTGYASLSHLTQFPVDLLKIDRSFINQIGTKGDAEAISSIVINLGHCLGLEVIAEGIETVEQQQHLIAMGCDTGQGYLYSRAIPAGEVDGFVRDYIDKATKPLLRKA